MCAYVPKVFPSASTCNGGLGRRYGSLGISLDTPQTRIGLRCATLAVPVRAQQERGASNRSSRISVPTEASSSTSIRPSSSTWDHSGTQLALATAVACCKLHGIDADTRELAGMLDRGLRSSIGTASFECGGVISMADAARPTRRRPCCRACRFPERGACCSSSMTRGMDCTARQSLARRRRPSPPRSRRICAASC